MASIIDHIAIRVVDPDKTADFLSKIGYQVTRRTTHHGVAVEVQSPDQPGLILELTALIERDGVMEVPGIDHLCFTVETEDDLTDLAEAGWPLKNKAYLVPGSERKVTSFKDADGVKWQLVITE